MGAEANLGPTSDLSEPDLAGSATLCVLGPLMAMKRIPSLAADPQVGAAEIAPSPRSSHSQEKVLQHQVQKLTLELKEQKEKAQLVRGRWDRELGRGSELG